MARAVAGARLRHAGAAADRGRRPSRRGGQEERARSEGAEEDEPEQGEPRGARFPPQPFEPGELEARHRPWPGNLPDRGRRWGRRRSRGRTGGRARRWAGRRARRRRRWRRGRRHRLRSGLREVEDDGATVGAQPDGEMREGTGLCLRADDQPARLRAERDLQARGLPGRHLRHDPAFPQRERRAAEVDAGVFGDEVLRGSVPPVRWITAVTFRPAFVNVTSLTSRPPEPCRRERGSSWP